MYFKVSEDAFEIVVNKVTADVIQLVSDQFEGAHEKAQFRGILSDQFREFLLEFVEVEHE